MTLSKERVQEIIGANQTKAGDTGSSTVQIALLTEKITYLTEHLKVHRKDVHSRRGLLQMVSQRNRLLKYVFAGSREEYRQLVERLGIRAKLEKQI